MTRVLCVWLPHWPIQRLISEQPRLRLRALALYEERGPKGAVVADCCSAASRQGVAPGMTLAEARSYAPALHAERCAAAADRLALEKLAACCQEFSPTVGLEEAWQPEALLLDVTGLDRLHGDEEALVRRLHRSFAGRGWHVRVGLADTPGAAWAVARFAADSGPIIVLPGETWAALRPLPVAALRLPEETRRWLGELGVERIEQLESLPRETLAERFGAHLVQRLDQAGGARAEPLVAHRPPPAAVAQRACEFPIARADLLETALEPLLAEIVRSLLDRQQGVTGLECRLTLTDGPPLSLSVGLFRASPSLRHLLDLLRLRLERLSLPAAVAAVRAEATAVAPLACRQRTLSFAAGDDADDALALAGLVDRLSSRLGRQCVLRARLTPDAEPEYACQYEPLAGGAPQAGPRRAKVSTPPAGWWRRPLRLSPQPVPLESVWSVHGGQPDRFVLHGREHRVLRAWGPERMETGWWRWRTARRDYYRVECAGGGWHWVFRRLEDGRWFWQGAFE
jgi:protein ImuB